MTWTGTPTVINETARVILNNPSNASYIHGTIFYNGYWYGTTRNLVSFSVNDGFLCRAPENNITAFEQIAIQVSNPVQGIGDTRYSHYMEQIVLCKGKLYATFRNTSLGLDYGGNWVLQYDPIVNDYKVYQIGYIYPIAPIISDGEYLYFSTGYIDRKVYKIDPDISFVSTQKYNANYNVPSGSGISLSSLALSFYDEDLQGGYITGHYDVANKGDIHSATVDGEYLYLAYTSPLSGFISGYDPVNGLTYCELHKVRKSDMTPAGWCYIPQSTDDMTQNVGYLFLGIEVQPTANPATRGYGWGAAAVRKSDLHLTATNKLHADDNPPINQSYGSLIFGNYLIDLRTNKYLVVLDISNPDSWISTENVGERTVNVFINKYLGIQNGVPLNEIVDDTSGRMYATYWSSQAQLTQFTIPGLSVFAVPTLDSTSSTSINNTFVLSSHILYDGGQPIIEKGFKWGTSSITLTNTIINVELTDYFSETMNNDFTEIRYFVAYAINSEGEGRSEVYNINYRRQIQLIYNTLGNQLGPFIITSDVGIIDNNTATASELISGKLFDIDNTSTLLTITSTGTCQNDDTLPIPTTSSTSTTSTTTAQ